MALPPRPNRLIDSPLRGIGLSLLGSGFIVFNDAAMKWVVSEQPIGQAIFIRGTFVLAALMLLAWRRNHFARDLRWHDTRAQLVSATLLTVPIFIYIYSLSQLPLSLATMVFFVNPLFVTVLAPFLANETVGWRRRVAVLVGFTGAVLVIRPFGVETRFEWVLLGPIIAAFLAAWRDLYLRKVLRHETSASVLLFSTAMVTLAALATSVLGWPAMSWADVGLLALAGLGFGLGIYCLTDALRFADASLLATYKYSAIVWALVIGFVVWNEVPDPSVWFGASLIVASGLYILYRERRVAQDAGL